MTHQPHASWAEVYDMAYRSSFGDFYDRWTDATVQWVKQQLKPPATIVDFGAGTGRLAIPLSLLGYKVVAVEPCKEMIAQLREKDQDHSIRVVCARMSDFSDEGDYEMALCVFTVILYLLDEDALQKSFAAAFRSLQPGGMFLLDVPSEAIFSSYSRSGPGFERKVSVIPHNGSIYTYREHLVVARDGGKEMRYQDEFPIRYWPCEDVLRILQSVGFAECEDVTHHFFGAGSRYYRFRKPN